MSGPEHRPAPLPSGASGSTVVPLPGPSGASQAQDQAMILTRVCDPEHELLERLQDYDLEAFGATGLRTYDLAVMAQAGAVFVATIGKEIVGGCQLMRVLDDPDFFYVVGFYIRPQWRGRHLARELLRQVAEQSLALGAKGLVLTASPTNAAALTLYKSAGFVEDRFVPHFYGDKEDRYILRWRFPEIEAGPGEAPGVAGAGEEPPRGPCRAVYDRKSTEEVDAQ
jgi:ribosomal protein S18 acetylase RimI-like enzyme